jgi:hypothetical protein
LEGKIKTPSETRKIKEALTVFRSE